jgi:hypothetical protein
MLMENQEARGRILKDVYERATKGLQVLHTPQEYASALGIPEEQALFNLRYLIKSFLLEGNVNPVIGGQEFILVTGLAPRGVEAIENQSSRKGLAVEWNVFNFSDVRESQISINSPYSQQMKADIKGSPGAVIAGDNAKITVGGSPQKPISMFPYTSNQAGYIRMGRWLMLRWFHSLDHSVTPFAYAGLLFTILFGGTVSVAYFSKTMLLWNPVVFVWSTATLVLAAIFWGSWQMGRETTCDNCHHRFTMTRRQRTLTGREDLPERDVRNYEDVFVCSNCGYAKRVSATEEIEKQREE